MGGGFRFEINVELEDIPKLDDSHKRDCADAVNKVTNDVFKYTMIFCAAVIIFFGVYSFLSVSYLMRTMEKPPQITIVIPAAAIACCVLEFAAGAMQRWAIVLEILLTAVILAASLALVQTVWIIPFAAYGIIAHIKLMLIYPFYKVISSQKGYPEFTPLPTKDDIAVRAAASEVPAVIEAEEKPADNGKAEEKVLPEETEKAEETAIPETAEKPAESDVSVKVPEKSGTENGGQAKPPRKKKKSGARKK